MRLKAFTIAIFGCFALSANAALTMTNIDGIEYRQSGNTFTWGPASPESTAMRGGTVVKSDVSVSTTAPKAEFKTDLPYKNNGGASAKATMTATIDPSKVGARAAQAMSKAAKGAGYFGAAAFACELSSDCTAAVAAMAAWGASQFKRNDDGSLSAVEVGKGQLPSYATSDGREYTARWPGVGQSTGRTQEEACRNFPNQFPAGGYGYAGIQQGQCIISAGGSNFGLQLIAGSAGSSSCQIGHSVINGSCSDTKPNIETPLQTYIQSNYTGKGWDNHWAQMTAAIVANGGNVFSDGTSVDITGPAIVPISTSTTKTPVNVVPGTTTPVPPGHTGPSQPGTTTTTTTTSANNKFNPGPFSSSGSGSSGGPSSGPASGPSLTTTQTTTTTTSVTNNITNITNITNETTTETDEPPEEAPTDTPFADLPELYKQKYPDGLIGVMRTQFTAMKATPLFSLPAQLMGDLPQTGQCPSWQLNLNFTAWANFGTRNIGADCAIWDFASWVVIISALILARQLVFGG